MKVLNVRIHLIRSPVVGDFTVFSGKEHKLSIFVGDIYHLTADMTGLFDAIWDCSALCAINVEDRTKYVASLLSLLKSDWRILMSAYEYNQSEHMGAPHSISTDILKSIFEKSNVELVETIDMSGTPFTERFHLSYANKLLHLLTP